MTLQDDYNDQQNNPTPDLAYQAQIMGYAGSSKWVRKMMKNKTFTAGMGFTTKDWNSKTGQFKVSGGPNRGSHGFMGGGRGSWSPVRRAPTGWNTLTPEMKGEFMEMVKGTMTDYLQRKDARKSATGLLDKIQAKSTMMEDLITKRRQIREEEAKQTRGLY